MLPRRLSLGLAAVLALSLAVGIGLANTLGDDDDGDEAQAVPTATRIPEEAAGEVVRSFIQALAARDVETMYALQEDRYKQVCDREAFEQVAQSLIVSPLEGPAELVVRGNTAGASLFEVQPDGRRERAVIPLVRQPNGDWRLAAPSSTRCTP
jgi:hypothetical protein